MSIICLYYNVKYILNFLIKINRDIYYNEYEFFLNIIIIILDFIYLLMDLISCFFFYLKYRQNERYNNNNEIQRNNNRNEFNVFSRAVNINNNIENHNNNIVNPVDQVDIKKNLSIKEDLRKDISSDSDNINLGKICIICLTNPIKVIFLPCKHRCYCSKCYNECKEKCQNIIMNCPICRKPIVSTILFICFTIEFFLVGCSSLDSFL